MQYTTLGRSGLQVSRVAFGTWQLGGEWGSVDVDAATAALRHARDIGITFFDTAQAYGFGDSEELLGRALADDLRSRRDEVVLATKGALRPQGDGVVRDAGRDWLRSGVEDSLRALGVDHVDLYQVHWPDPETPVEETAGALQELVDEGKVRHVGLSNHTAEQLAAFEAVRPVETLQPPYHLFRRGIEESVLPWCRQHDVGTLVYGPLAHGLLTGAMTADATFEDDDWRAEHPAFSDDLLRQNLEVVRRLEGVASDVGCTLPQLAIAWVLAQDGVDVAVVGSRSQRHIDGSAQAVDVRLDDDVLARIEEIGADAVQIGGATPEGTD